MSSSMISIQNGSFILPPDSNEEDTTNNNPHDRRNSARSLTTTQSQSELPDDALSHRASISTADDSPQSWDGDSPDYDEVKVHSQLASLPNSLSQNPPQPVSAAAAAPPPPCTAKPFAFGLFAAQHHPGSRHHHYNHHPDMDVIPKIEELDEDDDLENNIPNNNALQSEQQQQQQQPQQQQQQQPQHRHPPGAPVHVPRKRGRPRKHPLPVAGGGQVKITKGRSKTGCITCRRRKKKCDETKPACQNCQKNAVVCEGYPPKEIWKSGKQKLEDVFLLAAQNHPTAAIPRSLPILIDGVETDIDRRFLDHFVYGFSRVLTLINDDSNPFKEILLPMATQHRGLMHSLMCLAGSHLSGLDPEPKLKERKYYHFHQAIRDLKDNINASSSITVEDPELLVEDPIIASTIALSLNTICEGETNGEYRPHMDAARYLLVTQQPRNEKFRQFIVEFFQYHDVSNSITSLDRRPAHLHGDLRLPDFVPHAQAGMFLGVFDGLFNYISEVTRLRDRIRQRHQEGYEPAIDYQILSDAVSIDSAIRVWETSHVPNTANWSLAQLYRQSTWVYLYRTIRPSRPSDKIAQVVDDGLTYLDQLPQDAGAYSIVLMPLFLLGCSAFVPEQRERIQQGFNTLKAYSNLRNIEPALRVVERVWEVMDTNIEESWDWEKIIKDMNMDFLIT